jgi:hypothetical protein
MMAWFTTLGTLVGLVASGRILNPIAHVRMIGWSLGFWFELGPAMAGAALAGHHPANMVDPPFLPTWLRSYDPVTRTMPEWSMDLVEATPL